MNSTTLNRLLACTALISVSAIGSQLYAPPAKAAGDGASGGTAVANAAVITATDAGGLKTTAAAAITATINPTGNIVFGAAGGADSITNITDAGAFNVIFNVTDGTLPTTDTVTFAGDIENEDANNLTVNSTTTNLILTGDVTQTAAGLIAITLGDAAADPTLSLTVNTVIAEALVIDATINAVDAADVITLNVTNTEGTDTNTVTFSKVIGGAFAIDNLNVGNATTEGAAVFTAAVTAGAAKVTGGDAVTEGSFLTLNTSSAIGTLTLDDNLGAATATLGANVTLTGTVAAAGAGEGTLVFAAAGSVSGNIGATGAGNELKLVTINAGAVTPAGDVAATTVDFNADGSLTIVDGKALEAVVTNKTTNEGTLTLSGTSTVSGAVGSTGAGLKAINAGADAKTATFGGDVKTTKMTSTGDGFIVLNGNFTGELNIANGFDATVTLADGKTITGAVTNATTNEGTLTLSGTSTVSGVVGNTGAGLKAINAGAAGKTATFSGVTKTTLLTVTGTGTVALGEVFTGVATNFAADGVITVADAKNFTSPVTNTVTNNGTLTFLGANTVTGAIGSVGAGLKAINAGAAGKTVAFVNALKATSLNVTGAAGIVTLADTLTGAANFNADGTISVADGKTITGAVTNTTTNEGTLTVVGTSTFAGAVGSTGAGLKAINAGADAKTATFGGDVKTTKMTSTGDGFIVLNGNFTGELNIANSFDATVTLADGKTITGAVTNATTNEGTLTLSGTSTVSGAVGSTGAGLKAINAGADTKTATFSGDVKTTKLTSTGDGFIVLNGNFTGELNIANGFDATVTLADGKNITGTVTNATTNEGTLTLSGTSTVSGAVGSTGAGLKAINAGAAGKTATFSGVTKTTLLTVTGTGTVALSEVFTGLGTNFAADGVITVADGKDFTSPVTNAVTNNGTLTFLGANTVTGAIGSTGAGLKAINAGAAGKTVAFVNALKATSLNVTGAAGIVTLADTLTGAANFNADGTITLATTKIISGNVTTTTTNTGTLNLAGSHAMTGSLGAPAGNKLKVINLTGAAGVVSVDGDIGATTINLAAAASTLTTKVGKSVSFTTLLGGAGLDTLNLNGTTTGAIDLAGGAGNVITNAATGIFTGSVNATAGSIVLTNTALGQMTFTGASNLGAAGVLANKGITNLNAGVVLNAGAAVTAANNTGTFNSTITDLGVAGTLEVADIGSLASTGATAIDLSAAKANFIFTGATPTGTVKFAAGGAAAVNALAANVTDDSLFYSATLAAVGNDINLTVAFAGGGFASVTASPNTDAVATALQTIGNTGNASIDALVTAFAEAPTAAAADAIAKQIVPTVDGGAMQSAMSFSSGTMGVVASELAALRLDGGAVSGISAGNNGQGARFWLQAMAGTGEGDARDGINGYEADSYGFAAGIDTRSFGPNSVVGVAFSFSNADIDSANLNRTNTEIDSYQGTLYGSAGFGNMNYVSGMMGYVWSDNDTSRAISVPVASVANGNYDSDQFVANLEVGHDVKQGIMTFTPNVFANYGNYSADDYVESGPLGLRIASEDMDLFEMGLGADVAWDIKQSGDGVLRPSLSASYRYDFIADEMNSTSSFVGAPGVSFKTIGAEPEENKFNLGAGLKYSDNQWELSAAYGFDYMEDYDAHSGMIRAGFNF